MGKKFINSIMSEPAEEAPQPTSRTCPICGETVDLTDYKNTMFHYHLPEDPAPEKKAVEIPKGTNEYLVDIKIYEPYLVSLCPYEFPLTRGLFGSSPEGATFNTGYFTLHLYMTEKKFDEFIDWMATQNWIKQIGITTVAK